MDCGDCQYVAMTASPSPKKIWTQDDFENMGWHDNAVHAVALEYAPPWPGRVLLDIDYIVEWVGPDDDGDHFRFWICPATLVFDEASDFTTEVDLTGRSFELSLDEVVRSQPDDYGRRTWQLIGHEFSMAVVASGFTQYLRSAPILSNRQRLEREEREEPAFMLGEN